LRKKYPKEVKFIMFQSQSSNTSKKAYKVDNVWLVDDNLFVLEILKKTLTGYACIVDLKTFSTFTNAFLELRKASKHQLPGVIILDYDFGLEGTAEDFLKLIERDLPHLELSIYIYSSVTSSEKIVSTFSSPHIKGWIPKPCPVTDLIEVIEREAEKCKTN